jgi:hypothetical protein
MSSKLLLCHSGEKSAHYSWDYTWRSHLLNTAMSVEGKQWLPHILLTTVTTYPLHSLVGLCHAPRNSIPNGCSYVTLALQQIFTSITCRLIDDGAKLP